MHRHMFLNKRPYLPRGLLRWQKRVKRETKLSVRAHRDSQTGRRSHSVEARCSASCAESQSGQLEKQCSPVNSCLHLTPSTLVTSDREALEVPSNPSLRLALIFHSGHLHYSTFGTLVCLSRMTHFRMRSHWRTAFEKKTGWDRKNEACCATVSQCEGVRAATLQSVRSCPKIQLHRKDCTVKFCLLEWHLSIPISMNYHDLGQSHNHSYFLLSVPSCS